jgi:hypothetical protein
LGFETLDEQNSAIHECFELLHAGQDVESILRGVDEGFERLFEEWDKVKVAVEDIFNPSEEDWLGVD